MLQSGKAECMAKILKVIGRATQLTFAPDTGEKLSKLQQIRGVLPIA
jgi:hypothetical protein